MESMIQASTMLYLYVETPLHAGTGSGLSSIDLPIQRERTTQYPMIQGSGIKGKLRAAAYIAKKQAGTWSDEEINVVFGPDENGADHAGALIAGDARILLFPVRSLDGVFAYTTSYEVLSRFQRDIARSSKQLNWNGPSQSENQGEEQAAFVTTPSSVATGDTLVLEEFSFTSSPDPQVNTIAQWLAEQVMPQTPEYRYWREKLKHSLVILPNNDFRDFVVHATEVITRIRISRETKTVDKGMLWTEEHLPSDTLLYVPMYATPARKMKNGSNDKGAASMTASAILDKARSLENSLRGYIQLGGDETVGRGMVCMHWAQKEN
jgi:CRISPR-associated protein Cmr4